MLHLPATCAVGFSGIIFALLVADNQLRGLRQRSIYGIVNVPAAVFPWVLLLIWQLLIPEVSFLGHLGGVLAGTMYVRGYLANLIPKPARFKVKSLEPFEVPWLAVQPTMVDGATIGNPQLQCSI